MGRWCRGSPEYPGLLGKACTMDETLSTRDASRNGTQDTAGLLILCQWCGHERCYHTTEGRCVRNLGLCPCRLFVAASEDHPPTVTPPSQEEHLAHLAAGGDYICAVPWCGHALGQHDRIETRCRACPDGHGFVFVRLPPAPQRFCTEAEAWAEIGRQRTPA